VTEIRRIAVVLIVGLIAAVFHPGARGDDEPEPDVTDPPAYEEFLVIPLRVHILSASDLPEVDCHLSDTDISRIVGKVNQVWNKAGIHWGLESLVREPAARQEKFRLVRDLGGGNNLGVFRILLPEESRADKAVDLYYVHEFPVNGVWFGQEAIVRETAKLREVEGGIDEPIPRVSAHELGHALGLPHRQDRTNLLASGTTGTRLNAAEVKVARERARTIPGAASVADVRQSAEVAEAASDRAGARRLRGWLAEVPGADAARTHLGRLGSGPGPGPGPGPSEP
jgi:hypothetical protein